MIELIILFVIIVVSIFAKVYIGNKILIAKKIMNDMHMDSDKEIKRYVLPIENTYELSYVKVEIIQRDI